MHALLLCVVSVASYLLSVVVKSLFFFFVFFFCLVLLFLLIYFCLLVSVFFADLNINGPPFQTLHAKTTKIKLGRVIPVHAKATRGILCDLQSRSGSRWGPSFIPVLSAVIAVVLYWADMMPSHSMDLPVPRGTSMLMLNGEFTWNGIHTLHCRRVPFVSSSKYISLNRLVFQRWR